mmetsp:Transcript_12622/g.29978  ORF Transcript_12622/g.29978 Transcript_12622/m.29978 type:complete len:355 (-) Transcript_12622:73-1137(-)
MLGASFYGMQPGGLSADAYVDKSLRPLDAEHYSAAGLVPYRKRPEGGFELLLAREKPWNSFINAYDPIAWNVFGGKRVARQERSVEVTAVRCFQEAVGDLEEASAEVLHNMIPKGFYMWYPLGKFALILAEVEDGAMDNLPSKFAEAKEASPGEEYRILPMGVKKWKKQIEQLEWVPGEDLSPEAKFAVSDLLSNMLKVTKFLDFLAGRLDPAEAFPRGARPEMESNGYGKSKGKGKPKGKGKGKDMKGFGKMAPMYGKGMPMMPMPMQAPLPVYTAPPSFQPGSEEMQRQMYGEQLYVLVLPLAPSPYLAQKITGMLLELPENELMMNLTDREELQHRVAEALEVLKADGITS